MQALKVENLVRDFGGVRATNNVSFSMEEGEHVALIGPNGAGKTTLFNMLGGQLPASSGRMFFYGRDITRMPAHQRAHLGIARSFQVTTLFHELTVLDNMLLAIQGKLPSRFQMFHSTSAYKHLYAKAQSLLEPINLWEKKDELISAIAYGEQRKLEMALSLAAGPKLLLLDEPSCGLTAAESADIINQVNNLASDISVIIVAHDLDLVFGVAKRIIVLYYGEIISEGTVEQIRSDPKVAEIYMGDEETAEENA